MNIFEETTTLGEIARGRSDATKARLLAALPALAHRVSDGPSDEHVAEALWAIRLAYSDLEEPIPSSIAPLLEDLPPDAAPRCRRIQEGLGADLGPPP